MKVCLFFKLRYENCLKKQEIWHTDTYGEIELHSFTTGEALAALRFELKQYLHSGRVFEKSIRIITGRGKHSPNDISILQKSVSFHVKAGSLLGQIL